MPRPTDTRPWRHWYDLVRWKKRQQHQLRLQPCCVMCLDEGIVTAAQAVDHIVPHKGDYQLFWFGRLQSLCFAHHNSSKKQLEHKGYVNDIGLDGFPIDANHPFNRA